MSLQSNINPNLQLKNAPAYLKPYLDQGISPRQSMLQWLTDAKFGLFIHYGLYSLLGRHEWVQLQERIPVAEYAKLADEFTAEKFDADAIAKLAVDAGMRYVTFTTRHHDSFCLWDTKTTPFNSINAPRCRRDLVAELADACAKHKIGLCLYLSHGRDWRHPHAPNNDQYGGNARPLYDPPEPTYATGKDHDLQQYLDYLHNQVTELLTQYGPIASIWLDGIAVPKSPLDASGNAIKNYRPTPENDPFKCQDLYDHVHAMQPWTLVSYKQSYLGTEDYLAPEHNAVDQGNKLGEICTTLTPGSWGFNHESAGTQLSAQQVWDILAKTREHPTNLNLLLNSGPMPDGQLNPVEVKILEQLGQWINQRGYPGQSRSDHGSISNLKNSL
ncbi:MAG: alpha-L-fucosidase [Phycisphaeraceae bacterium]|nr:alpha-L-fucosidase [Phycisphaeraceae bacterium]